MKTDNFKGSLGIEQILDEVKRFADYVRLSEAEAMKLRLLAEEMMGLVVRLFEDDDYEFYIESNEKRFMLILIADVLVNLQQKDKILTLSKEGKNIAEKGILGKISGVFQDMLMGAHNLPAGDNLDLDAAGGEDYRSISTYMHHHNPYSHCEGMYFSMANYRNLIPSELKNDQWDGLEQSIIANIATDVVVGVRNDRVEMMAVIDF